jgi:hypothetical protein
MSAFPLLRFHAPFSVFAYSRPMIPLSGIYCTVYIRCKGSLTIYGNRKRNSVKKDFTRRKRRKVGGKEKERREEKRDEKKKEVEKGRGR